MPSAPEEVSNADNPQSLQDVTVPSFFSLPREIRDMIYHLVIGVRGCYRQSRNCYVSQQEMVHLLSLRGKDLWPTCGRFNIARTCRIANEEANEVIYKRNEFLFYAMSKKWLRPQINQKITDMMQSIHIVCFSDKNSQPGLVPFLQTFTSCQIVRKKCWIELFLNDHDDIEAILSISRVLMGFTAFEVVTIEMPGSRSSFRSCQCSEHVQARSEWKQIRKDLESALGTAVSSLGKLPSFSLFKPREHLAQKGLSS